MSALERLSESQKQSLEQATARYHENLEAALPYLARRGISEQTANTYRLGVVPVGGATMGDERYEGRLAIPYITANRDVVALRFRSITDETPKYLSRTGTTTHLFGVSCLLGDSTDAVVVEGEIDQMTLTQMGVTSVGIPGVKAYKKSWRHLFTDFDRIIVLADGDEPGRDFARSMVNELGAVMVELPAGEDTNSIYVNHGADQLKEILRAL